MSASRLSPEQEAREAALRREADKSDKPNSGPLFVHYHETLSKRLGKADRPITK